MKTLHATLGVVLSYSRGGYQGRKVRRNGNVIFSKTVKAAVRIPLLRERFSCSPAFSALHSPLPAAVEFFPSCDTQFRLKPCSTHFGLGRNGDGFPLIFPKSCRKPCKICCAQGSRFRDGSAFHRNSQDIGLKLAEKVVA